MRKFTLLFTLIVLITGISKAQSDLAFYHLGSLTPQSSINNPSFFPDAEFYISLPGISGINTKMNSRISYNQLMIPVEGTDSVKIDLAGALSHLKEGDNVRVKGDVSLFQFGIRSGDKAFSLFANLRYGGGFNYPVNFLNYFVNGNGNYIGEHVEENKLKGGGIAYQEIGLGYSQELLVRDKTLRVGGRLKYLHGLVHASISKDASMTLYTDPDTYDINVQFSNATLRTAGFNELQGDNVSKYMMGFGGNSNKGFAIDLGAEMTINEKLNASLALNDLGFIRWKQDIENYTLQNSSVTLGGFDDVNDVDVAQALEDSLDMWTEYDTGTGSFKTPVGARLIAGANYLVSENGSVSGTIAYNQSSYRSSEIGFGIGYTHQFGKILTLSTTISKDQFRRVKVGGGFAARFGALQLYGAFDDLLNGARDAGDLTGMDARVGINLLIGRSNTGKRQQQPKVKKEKEELSPFPPEYDLDHLLDTDEGDSQR